jgi:hypothetical protein
VLTILYTVKRCWAVLCRFRQVGLHDPGLLRTVRGASSATHIRYEVSYTPGHRSTCFSNSPTIVLTKEG